MASVSIPNEKLAARIAIVEEHIRLENAHDLEGVVRTFGETARYDDEPWDAHYEGRDQVMRRSALRRLAEVEDVAAAVEFLLGPGGRNITGTVMTIDAGNTA